MREIKFRAWNGNAMFLDWQENSEWMLNESFSKTEYNIMQYTGLKDKNDVEIYEGDILKSRRTKLNYQVVWDNEEARYAASCVEPEKDFAMGAYAWHENKIIGNIHQNSELLK